MTKKGTFWFSFREAAERLRTTRRRLFRRAENQNVPFSPIARSIGLLLAAVLASVILFTFLPLAHRMTRRGVGRALGVGGRKIEVTVTQEDRRKKRKRKKLRRSKTRQLDRMQRQFLNRFAMDLDVAGIGGAGVGDDRGLDVLEFEEGETDTDPRPIGSSQRDPVYPARAREAAITGVVVMRFLVDEHGSVRKTQIVTEDPPNFGFGASVRDVVLRYRFRPATLQGLPVRVWVQREFQFRL